MYKSFKQAPFSKERQLRDRQQEDADVHVAETENPEIYLVKTINTETYLQTCEQRETYSSSGQTISFFSTLAPQLSNHCTSHEDLDDQLRANNIIRLDPGTYQLLNHCTSLSVGSLMIR